MRNLFAIRGLAFTAAFIMYLAYTVYPVDFLWTSLTYVSLFLFFTAFIGSGKFYFLVSTLLIVCSILVVMLNGESILHMMAGFADLLKLILFISLIPLISYPAGEFVKDLKVLVAMLNKKAPAYKLAHYFSFFLANLINLAAIPIAKVIFIHKEQQKDRQAITAELIGRSFGIAMMITPVGAAIAMAIDLTGTKWITILPINLVLVVVGLWLSYYMAKRKMRFEDAAEKSVEYDGNLNKRRLILVFAPLCGYFLFLFLVEWLFHFGIMETIVVSVLPFTFIWSVCLKDAKGWYEGLIVRIFKENPRSFGLYAIIISASLFIHTLEVTGIDHVVMQHLPWIGVEGAVYFYIPATMLFILALSSVGVHQFIGMIFAAKLINPELFGMDEAVFSSALLVGFVAGMQGSPFSGANILISGLLPQLSSYEIGKNNGVYVLLWICISSILLICINQFI